MKKIKINNNFTECEILKHSDNIKCIDIHFILSIDTYDKFNLCYTLSMKSNDIITVLLNKVIHNENEFSNEVQNLSKYFNVKIIGE